MVEHRSALRACVAHGAKPQLEENQALVAAYEDRVELAGFAPYIVGTVPLGPVELSARAGYYIYDLETSVDIDDLGDDVFTSDDSGEDFVYGVGVGLTMFERLNARLEYEIVDLTGADADAFWLSGSWRF